MIVAVLDTNVLVSGIIGITNPNNTPGEILRLWRSAYFGLVVSDAIVRELHGVFEKPYFLDRITDPLIQGVLDEVVTNARYIAITTEVSGVASHVEDDLILATARSGDADVLVTGDRALLDLGRFDDARILTPTQFLELLSNADSP